LPLDRKLEEPAPKSSRWLQVLLVLVMIASAGFSVGALGLYLGLEHVARDLPSVEKLKAGYDPPQITRILARDETLLASVFTERRTVVGFDQVPDVAKLAFLAAEDASFYEHEGLNYLGMLRALSANIRAGKTVQGGSTITQQVVKNVLLDAERSYRRKIRETVLARRLEQSLTKDEIFWLYLNHIYLGHGRYGIEEAARYYFGKPTRDLSLDEAATLAGLVAAPERFSPRKDPDQALRRREYVLGQMLKKGFVTQQLYESTHAKPLRLAPAEESESHLAPEMVDRVRSQLRQSLGEAGRAGGYTVHTTIDPKLQAAARAAVRENLDAYMTRHQLVAPFTAKQRKLWGEAFDGEPRQHGIYTGVVAAVDDRTGTINVRVGSATGRITLSAEARYNPKRLPPSEFTAPGAILRVRLQEQVEPDNLVPLRLELGPQSGLVAIDVRTREVVALVGSYEAITGGLDRASQARRQPGSTFKPFVYSYALYSRRFTPATMVPVKTQAKGVVERKGTRTIAVRNALAQSNNEATVEILRQSGADQVVQWARALGVSSKIEADLSLALGSYEMTVLELANAYSTFASGGLFAEPRFLTSIRGPSGTEKPLPAVPAERQVISPEVAYLTTSLLRSVVDEGTGAGARQVGREVAGKTGTTNEAKDTWFAGFSTDLVAVVWVGYDDARPLGKSESGARTALPAWVTFMKAAHVGRPATAFRRPSGILQVAIDSETGLLPRPDQLTRKQEEFLAGTEPTEIALAPDAGVPTDREPARSHPAADAGPAPPPF
jgi:penicillin-binding protein 1A